MSKFHGTNEGLGLFSSGSQAVLVNLDTFDVFDPQPLESFDLALFIADDNSPTYLAMLSGLANDCLPVSTGGVTVISSSKPRAYRVPKAVQENAQFALSKVRKSKVSPSPVALNSARSLVHGGSISLPQIKNMARFFQLLAAKPTADEQDSLSWELFGGDAARRWSLSIVAQIAPTTLTAAPEPSKDKDPVEAEDEFEDEEIPDSVFDETREVDPDTEHVFEDIDGLPDICGVCAGTEQDERHVDYEALPEGHPQLDGYIDYSDEPPAEPTVAAVPGLQIPLEMEAYPTGDVEFFAVMSEDGPLKLESLYHTNFDGDWYLFSGEARDWTMVSPPVDAIPLDDDTAYAMMDGLTRSPETSFDLRDCYPEETAIFIMAESNFEKDVDELTRPIKQFTNYTPAERSVNAKEQVRDRNGRFARSGTNVKTTDSRKGRVVGYNQDRDKVEVKMDDSHRSEFYDEKEIAITKPGNLDSKPRLTEATPKARLNTRLPVLDPDEIKQVITDYEKFIVDERKRISSSKNFADNDPTTSDVRPIYLAIVDDLDPTAVLDLVALSPKSKTSNAVTAFRREDKKWIEDGSLLLKLKSVTPPKVVTLDTATYHDVVKQVDAWVDDAGAPAEEEEKVAPATETAPAMSTNVDHLLTAYGEYGETIELAQGGFDRNRGNAEVLRRYWLYGPGAAKIMWNTPGDWTRCRVLLSKYMGPRAAGYCFSGDTKIITRDGTQQLEELVGQPVEVLTAPAPEGRSKPFRADGKWVQAEVHSFGEQELLTVVLRGGRRNESKTIRATAEHTWFASKDGRTEHRKYPKSVTTSELKPGMVLASLLPKSAVNRTKPSPFGIAAGFVYGDGSHAGLNQGSMADLWGEKDANMLQYFEGCNLAPTKIQQSGVLGTRVRGLPRSWKDLPRLDEGVSYLLGWLAGYIAADGTVTTQGTVELASSVRENLEFVRDLSTRLGISTYPIRAAMRLGTGTKETPIYGLSFISKTVPSSMLVIPEHRRRFEARTPRHAPVRWRVESVEDLGEREEVFCAVVPETETFALEDNIWVHNCQLRHKDATGLWTGDALHRSRGFGDESDSVDTLTSEEVITAAATRASLRILDDDVVPVPESIDDIEEGAPFHIPVVVPVGVETGDGRTFASESLTTRDFPLPLMWQIKTGSAHDGAVVVGRVDGCEVSDRGLVNGHGVFDTGPYAQEAERLVRNKFMRGISADLDQFEASAIETPEENLGDDDPDISETPTIAPERMEITAARLTGVTLVPKPAFQECTIELDDQSEDLMKVPDGVYVENPDEEDAEPLMAAAMLASAIPVNPPAEWFENPGLKAPTPLQVDNSGRVFGHIAAWHVDHIGLPFSTRPPRSRSNYAYFHTGTLQCDDDSRVPVGQLTLAGGHAPLDASAEEAVRHYDDTLSAIADVHAGEDEHGIWVAGAMRPGVTPEQIRAFQASAPSGDWRPIGGRLEMVAVCQVNVPGFPITRARVASGHVYALVAAGASVLAKMRTTPTDDLAERLTHLEDAQRQRLTKARNKAVQRIQPVRDQKTQEIQAVAAAATEKVNSMLPTEAQAFKDVSKATRKEYAKRAWALPDGSYPIKDQADLKNAVQAYGRSNPEDRAKVRRHIMKRARALGRTDLIPTKWTSASVEERFSDIRHQFYDLQHAPVLAQREEARERFSELAAKDDKESEQTRRMISANPDFDESRHPRDAQGRFRDVVARLRDQLKSTPDAATAVEALDEAGKAEAEKNFQKARQAADRAIHILDAAAQGTRDIGSADTMRDAARQLGKVIAFLPVAVGVDTVSYSFQQFSPEIQSLIRDLIERAELVDDPSDDAQVDLSEIKGFVSGADQWTSGELGAALSRLVRLLL